MKKLILRSNLSPGDIVMMTAAVRDLHAAHPGEYLTDVRTPCPALWEHNPNITPIPDGEGKEIHLHYPLIQGSNQRPYHFIHGYRMDLEELLGERIPAGDFKGDIHLSEEEKGWTSQVAETEGPGPFWIIVSGGKFDFTAKHWDPARLQAAVDHYRGRIRFVQVGEANHYHPEIAGALDLRGKTTLRQLVRLVYHSAGVICPVTSLMHLAAAVPTRDDRLRPCVVVAGGREPSQWEAYPGHRFLDTIGALDCCATGGCWKSRVVALGDGDEKDKSLCSRPTVSGATIIPRCLDLITAEDVIRAVDSYAPAEKATACCGKAGSAQSPKVKDASPEKWGPSKWLEFHTRPDRLRIVVAEEAKWLRSFTKSLPCLECRTHFAAVLEEIPFTATNPDEYFQWTVRAHNAVNVRIGKPEFPMEAAERERRMRFTERTRMQICARCEHLVKASRNGPAACGLSGKKILQAIRNPVRACPAGRWPAVEESKSRIGVVIGTYAAVPYVHLQLEARQRYHPDVPYLVIDDGSPDAVQLAKLCASYGAEFRVNRPRIGHIAGDMTVFIQGLDWARNAGLEYLVKFSRRWIPMAPWVDEALALFDSSGAATLSSYCTGNGFGFRTECVAMDVRAWSEHDALANVRHEIERALRIPPEIFAFQQNTFLVEGIVHHSAMIAARGASKDWHARQIAEPPRAGCDHYTNWPMMGTNRKTPIPGVLWHESNRAAMYHALARAWGLPYAEADFINPAANLTQ